LRVLSILPWMFARAGLILSINDVLFIDKSEAPMQSNAFLPMAFRWLFTVLEVLGGICIVVGLMGLLLIHPHWKPGAHVDLGNVLGQHAEFTLQPPPDGRGEPVVAVNAFNGSVVATVTKPAGLIAVIEQYGIPIGLFYALSLTVLFDLMRRLFRNVGHGESFTPQSVGLVQIIGGVLIALAIVSAIGENLFAHALYGYLVQHTDIAVSGTPLRLPQPTQAVRFDHWLPLGRTTFWCGLLVLALAEVFRQGLALQRDADLTV
jgi:uncharacterized membrane protein YphA (DoxX/SURF4 family)